MNPYMNEHQIIEFEEFMAEMFALSEQETSRVMQRSQVIEKIVEEKHYHDSSDRKQEIIVDLYWELDYRYEDTYNKNQFLRKIPHLINIEVNKYFISPFEKERISNFIKNDIFNIDALYHQQTVSKEQYHRTMQEIRKLVRDEISLDNLIAEMKIERRRLEISQEAQIELIEENM